MADLYEAVAVQRRQLADALDGLTNEQWDTPSLCGGWRVRNVVAHLLSGPEVKILTFLGVMARNRFDFHKSNDQLATSDTRSPGELTAALRANAGSRFHPPGFGPEAPLTDITVHSGDILLPLGLPHEVPADNAQVALSLLSSPRGERGFGKKGRLEGFSYRTTDVDWTHGSGPVVEGPAEPMIMAMGGRMVGFDALEGDGVASLRSRFD
jgi:uncharacterized protein (TIGR03083 family)